ncbi:class I tRNA ligase family protein [Micromonospora sp. DT48]|uniref:class I tRNA ligase family protein n=1 Tax=unclassified Micromonospora TaxID=2617518 RepID=UPI0018AD2665|nr:class I tRNA ligase family protein [Micromonospora sp. CP22]
MNTPTEQAQQQPWLVIAPPPTPNGDLHLGHLSGPYLAADIFARHQRRKDTSAVYLCGLDDHQTYTALQGIRDGRTPEQVADDFGARIEAALDRSGMSIDVMVRPRGSARYTAFVQDFIRLLHERGQVVARERPLPYCAGCARWCYEAYVSGGCPHCGAGTGGNACESCGWTNQCADLSDPTCTVCGLRCELRQVRQLVFPLEPHRDRLAAYWADTVMSPHVARLCRETAAAGLPELAVTYPGDWGIPATVEGFTDQRIYVWAEMAAGYLGTYPGHPDLWRRSGRVVQFSGYDNAFFYAAFFPALMTAFDSDVRPPTAFVTNEFYQLDGLKFSTSRRHAIWLREVLDEVPADLLRLYLAAEGPAVAETNFTWPQFELHLRGVLLPRWARWWEELSRRAATSTGAARPLADRTVEQRRFRSRVQQLADQIDQALDAGEFSTRRAVALLDLLVREAADFGAAHDVARAGIDGLAGAVDLELEAAAVFALCLSPIAPTTAQQVWAALGLAGQVHEVPWADRDALPVDRSTVVGLDQVGKALQAGDIQMSEVVTRESID